MDCKYNLPAPRDTFVGRDKELATLRSRLIHSADRLITLIGPGGTGKTRLAIEVAHRLVADAAFPNGIIFADLAPVQHVSGVVRAIVQALGISETGDIGPPVLLAEHLREKQLLLILDNLEHLPDTTLLIGDLLNVAARLKILVTSRVLLHISGEFRFDVEPLGLPDYPGAISSQQLVESDAVRLFVERAAIGMTMPLEEMRAIAEICARLDGLPLAIELAAARLKSHLMPRVLLARLRSHGALRVLNQGPRDAPARQQTIRNTITWSYSLLASVEQLLVARLAIFVGGWVLETAQQVVAGVEPVAETTPHYQSGLMPEMVADLLDTLIECHLVRAEVRGDEVRYHFLEIIREYALERLAALGEESALRQRHMLSMLRLAEQASPALEGHDQRIWLERLEDEQGNLGLALDWAEAHEPSTLVHLIEKIEPFWNTRGYMRELDDRVERALRVYPGQADRTRMKLLLLAGETAEQRDETKLAQQRYEEAVAIAEQFQEFDALLQGMFALERLLRGQGQVVEAGYMRDKCLALANSRGSQVEIGRAIMAQGWASFYYEEYETAAQRFREGLVVLQAAGSRRRVALAHQALGWALFNLGQVAEARRECNASLTIWRDEWQRASYDVGGLAAFNLLNALAGRDGRDDEARRALNEHLALTRLVGHRYAEAYTCMYLGNLAWRLGDKEEAQYHIDRGVSVLRQTGYSIAGWIAIIINSLLSRHEYAEASALAQRELDRARAAGYQRQIANLSFELGRIAEAQGDFAQATAAYHDSLALFQSMQRPLGSANAYRLLSRVALAQGDIERAQQWLCESLCLYRERGILHRAYRSLILAGRIAIIEHHFVRACRLLAAATNDPGVRVWDDIDREGQAQASELARQGLGPDAFAIAWGEGTRLLLEDAIAYALGERAEPPPARRPPRTGDVPQPEPANTNDPIAKLTPKERDVLELLVRGMENSDIADQLCITVKTVSNHLNSIYDKFGMHKVAVHRKRSELLILARQSGLDKPL